MTSGVPVDSDPFAAAAVLGTVPSTEAQREIWSSVQMGDGASCAFNQSVSLRLNGALDVAALRSAVQGLVQRHEALRGTLSADGTTLHIAPSLSIAVPLIDLSGIDEARRLLAESDLVGQEVTEPFDLVRGPLVRTRLVRLRETEHLLLITAHHIICDGWSIGVLLRELGALYTAIRRGVGPALGEAERFSEYAAAQQRELGGVVHAKAEAYWLGQFANPVPALELPTHRPRPPERSFHAAREDRELDERMLVDLRRLGTQIGCPLFTTLLGALAAFLYRLSGQDDVVVGLLAAGQPLVGRDRLVGHCVHALPLRSRLNGTHRVADYLRTFRNRVSDAYQHHQYTFGTLVRKLPLRRDPSRIPLLSVVFNGEREVQGFQFDGLQVTYCWNPRRFENFELYLNAVESEKRVRLECTYNSDLFEAATIRRRLEEFEVFLGGIAADRDQAIGSVPILPPAERHTVLVEWNDTRRPYPDDICVHQLFERQVERTPHAEAVVCGDERLTYRELNQRANRVAYRLRALGVGPDVTVGLCTDRSAAMVVGMLGILKAGGAYVPLDPANPQARLAFMTTDCRMRVLVTQTNLRSRLPDHGVEHFYLDADGQRFFQNHDGNPASGARPTHLMYVIYTSGSTGKPKGVEVSHASVVNFLTSMAREPGLAAQDTMLAITPLSFDIAVLELILPLTVGARIVLVGRDVAADGSALLEQLTAAGITVMQATPATWSLLLQAGWEGSPALKVLCGGEALSQELARQLLRRAASVWNLYGPTETAVWSTCGRVTDAPGPVAAGRPIANTTTYILDRHLQPVAVGTPGELYVGGVGLARGYLNRPDLTAERFIANPFTADPARLYRTGDQAKYRPDGSIELLGRLDHQVKLRGFRIELGEIEAALRTHEAVAHAVVLLREDQAGDPRLVAYVVPRPGQEAKLGDCREYLRDTLPDYMVPRHVVPVDRLPLTPHGKVDRSALPPPSESRPEPSDDFVAPHTAAETAIADIWQRLLGIDRVGMYDNFFDLGGHSLLAMTVIAQIQERFGHRFRLLDLARQTLGQLAAVCERRSHTPGDAAPPPWLWRAARAIKTGLLKA
jgi:amino acid adenylation domain-containing protein